MTKNFFHGFFIICLVGCSPGENQLLEAGISKMETENYREAISYFDRVLAVNPANIKAYNAKSFALFALHEYEKVVENSLEAIRIDSLDYRPYYNMANARLELGEVREAIENYNKAMDIKPNEADIYLNRGTGYYRIGAYVKAIEDFNFALRLNKSTPSVFYNRAKTYLKLDSLDMAIKDFATTVDLAPGHAEAHYWLGLSKILQGKREEGCANLKKSKALGFEGADLMINKNCQ